MTEAARLEDEAATQLARLIPPDVEVVDRPDAGAFAEFRTAGIGGTDVPAILGLSKWRTPFDVYASKLHLVAPPPMSEEAIMGTLLEPLLFQRLADVKGVRVLRVEAAFRRKAEPFIVCNPDGFVLPTAQSPEPAIAEGKTRSEFDRKKWGEDESDEVPDEERLQAEYYCAITKIPNWIFPVFFGRNLVVFKGKANPEIGEELVGAARTFWNEHVVPQIPPKPMTGEAAEAWLRKRFPENVNAMREPTPAELDLVRTWKTLKDGEKDIEQKIEAVANEIKLAIGDADGLKGTGFSLTWKKVKGKTTIDFPAALTEFRNEIAMKGALLGLDEVQAAELLRLLDANVKLYTKQGEPYRRFNPSRSFEI